MGRTRSYRNKAVLGFEDDVFSPKVHEGMWADFPRLAILQDPSLAHGYSTHFNTFVTGDWVISTVEDGAGDATEALTDELGGVLLITNDAGAVDEDEFQLVNESFQLVPGKPAWVEGGFKINDVTQSAFLFGLCIRDTTLITAMSDGIWFGTVDGDANLHRHCEKNAGDTTVDTGVDLVDATWVRLGLKFSADGKSVEYWVNGKIAGTSITTIPDDELLSLSFALMNGEAVAKTLSADYLEAWQMLGRY